MNIPTTYGWDMVLAARTSILDADLAGTDATLSETVPHGSGPVDVTGHVGAWQFAPGGAGALVKFTVACSRLTLRQGTKSFTFKDGSFLVEARLALVDHTDIGAAADAGARVLTIVAGPGAVTVQGAMFDDPTFDGFAVMAVAGFQAWLDAQATLPQQVATIATTAAHGAGPRAALTPTNASYAYADATDGSDGVLALLCGVTSGSGDTSQLLQEVDPSVLAVGDITMIVAGAIVDRLVGGAASAATWSGHPVEPVSAAANLCLPLRTTGGA